MSGLSFRRVAHIDTMLFLSFIWLIVTLGVLLGYICVEKSQIVPDVLRNLYLFGKSRTTEKHSRYLSNFLQLPKRWFWHFYFVGIIVNSAVLLVAVTTYFVPGELSPHIRDFLTLLRFPGCNESDLQPPLPVLLSLLMMEIQVIRRFLECLFISIYGNSVMSVVIYIVGAAYYSAIGLSAISLTHEEIISTDNLYSDLRWNQVLAVLMFIYASWKQNRLGIILAKLRKDKNGKVEDVKHHIPNGDLFEYCSCPHFFMEILIYAAICTVFLWQHEVLNCVFVFVLVNQTLSGLMSHKWYREKFPSYPKNRRAVLPFIL